MKFAFALREKFREGYGLSDLRADVLAGLVVGLVALPLGMALAIAVDVAPIHGITTVIFGGFFVALLGGSRMQVTGPTAAFVVILVPIVHNFGVAGLLVAGLMAGVILIIMGVSGLGRLIHFIPYPVTTGFTSGIAVVIAVLQMKDFFGLKIEKMPESFIERAWTLTEAIPTFNSMEVIVASSTLGLLLLWQSAFAANLSKGWSRKIPAPLIILSLMALVSFVAPRFWPDFSVATIRSRFGFETLEGFFVGIPQTLPSFQWPWNFAGPDGHALTWTWKTLESLVLPATSIAILGAIESLLSAVVADGMARTKHDPDTELFALGIGNMICPFFGGIAATGALARTATNIRYGARSPISAMIHALFVLLIVLLLAPLVSFLPMASLSALLVVVALNMFEAHHFKRVLAWGPRSDKAVLLTCFGLTIFFDMIVGVTTGIILAAFLFIKRMADTSSHQIEDAVIDDKRKEAKDTVVYRIEGPLFFGAAQKAIATLERIDRDLRCVIFDLKAVHTLDMTGLVALEECFQMLSARKQRIILRGLSQQPRQLLQESGWLSPETGIQIENE